MHRVEGEGVRKPEVRVQREYLFFAVKDDEKEEEWMRKRGGVMWRKRRNN